MKLRKVEWWEAPRKKVINNAVSVIKETLPPSTLEPLRKDIEWLKKRRPEYVGGSGATVSYHRVTATEMSFRKTSFQPGINVIGVASGAPTTLWLPHDLEPNHLIAVKDELGVAGIHPITLRVKTS